MPDDPATSPGPRTIKSILDEYDSAPEASDVVDEARWAVALERVAAAMDEHGGVYVVHRYRSGLMDLFHRTANDIVIYRCRDSGSIELHKGEGGA